MSGNNRVLLLHGNRQTHDIFKARIGALVKKLRKMNLETSVSSPHTEGPILYPLLEGDDVETRGWWEKDQNFGGLDHVIERFSSNESSTQPPSEPSSSYVGIIGFSQGARLITLLCAHPRFREIFPNVRWAIAASGYHDEWWPSGFGPVPQEKSIPVPSLHVIGKSDNVVSPSSSMSASSLFVDPTIHLHEGGHHVPMRSSDLKVYLSFIETAMADCGGLPSLPSPTRRQEKQTTKTQPPEPPSPENLEEQMDEIEALTSIYEPSEFVLLTLPSEYPQKFRALLFPWFDQSVWLEFTLPPGYPSSSPPIVALHHSLNLLQFRSNHSKAVLKVAREAMERGEGMCCVMGVTNEVREWFEDGGMEAVEDTVGKEGEEGEGEEEEEREEEKEERYLKAEAEGLDIAMRALYGGRSEGEDRVVSGGHLSITVGLVGKPSAGKSTFFNAATAFSRQSGGEEGAKMGAAPFTTIEPNLGYAFVPAPEGSMPEDDCEVEGVVFGSEHGRDGEGRRLVPVMLKDVAGLVPGAYKGLGKGNKFLDDLTDANVLVQITDASGRSDSNGNIGPEVVVKSPLDDACWIRRELVQWVSSNVSAKFGSVVRLGRDRLASLFTGYKQGNAVIHEVMDALKGGEEGNEDFKEWGGEDIRRLVSCFLAFRFPAVIALNKVDKMEGEGAVEELLGELPKHGIREGVGLCAKEECEFVKLAIQGQSGTVPILPTSHVWKTLQLAVALSECVFVFPVSDLETCLPLPSMLSGGGGKLSTGHLRSLESRGGSGPVGGALKFCVTMKKGSTVDDLFSYLKGCGYIGGMFVRAEGMGRYGGKGRQVRKDEVLGRECRIIRIMTNKNRAHGGEEGGKEGGKTKGGGGQRRSKS
ncbi:hypothetical protein TrCOL_g11976 [Triparma columacea]|uniref:RWD domain-containing protein n=1 Tax=Triparma columacea TaxID=722753 RepID=A0A9W7GED9_9STRA|nr:hypothetical protein TrCOL_g11976 [Triparma columacea]